MIRDPQSLEDLAASRTLIGEVRERRDEAVVRWNHYRRLESLCAKHDAAEALKDTEFLTRVLCALDPAERRLAQ